MGGLFLDACLRNGTVLDPNDVISCCDAFLVSGNVCAYNKMNYPK